MTIHKPLSQRRALRALAEGARPTPELLADASGRSDRTLGTERRARTGTSTARRRRTCRRGCARRAALLDRVEAVGRAAVEAGGQIDKAEIDGIMAIIARHRQDRRNHAAARRGRQGQTDQTMKPWPPCCPHQRSDCPARRASVRRFVPAREVGGAPTSRGASGAPARASAISAPRDAGHLAGDRRARRRKDAARRRMGERAGARAAAVFADRRSTARSRWSARRSATCAR